MTTLHTVSFKRTVLATLISLCLSRYTFALQEISDDGLSQATGEGIAFLPQDAFMLLQKADDATKTTAQARLDLANRALDTGYINYIPVGPLTSVVQDTNKDGLVNSSDHSVGKADIFLYGLALSKNALNNSNSRFDVAAGDTTITTPRIGSWGSVDNPWLFKTVTAANVPNFAGTNSSVTYLNLEAPLYQTTLPTTVADGMDAYNLKLGVWVDAFVRNQNLVDGHVNQFRLGEAYNTTSTANEGTLLPAERANRLRLQGILNGFSLNGSNLQVFQTLDGSDNNNGMSAFYNKTLGISGIIRLNTGDSQNFKAVYDPGTKSRTYSTDGGTNYTAGATSWRTVTTGCGDTSANFYDANCQIRLRDRKVKDSVSGASWSLPAGFQQGNKVLRFSTKETSNTNNLTTPALSSTSAPTFDANEGLYLYYPNINLVLGNLYQPMILGSDGTNFSLEIARIPNKPEIYKKIYTDYSGSDTSYLGSTCNIYQCGDSTITGYQGGSPRTDYALANGTKLATHSSISIGTAYSPDGGKTLRAYDGFESMGIFFGAPVGRTGITGSKIYNEAQYQQRKVRTREYLTTDRYVLRSQGGAFSGGSTITDPYDQSTITAGWASTETRYKWITIQGSHDDWVYLDGFNPDGSKNFSNVDGSFTQLNCTTAFACPGGRPYGGAAAYLGQKGTVSSASALQTLGSSFVAGGDDCWTGESGNNACSGTSQSGEGVFGLSRLMNNDTTPPPANNLVWEMAGSVRSTNAANRWFQVTGGLERILYGSASDPAPAIPTGGINPSALNNYGSAVIDGLLIQHMKFTTKGL